MSARVGERDAATAAAGALIAGAQRIVILSHIGPDPDTTGSNLGLALTLEAMGKTVESLIPGGLPPTLSHLKGGHLLRDRPTAKPDLVIVVDAASTSMVGPNADLLVAGVPVVVIDHHDTNPLYGTVNIVDPSASSTGEMIQRFIRALGYALSPDAAFNLYTALLGDTGGFRNGATTPEALAVASDLVAAGVSPAAAADALFGRARPQQLRLEAEAIQRMQTRDGGRFVWVEITKEMRQRTGATLDEVTSVIPILQRLGDAAIMAAYIELDDGAARIELRAREPFSAVDIAVELGGGGHIRAAGVRHLPGGLATARRLVAAAAHRQLEAVPAAPDPAAPALA
jgi:phosphoesterase RecJ-like protein